VRFKKTKKDEAAKAHLDDIIEGEWRKSSLLGSSVDVLVLGDAVGEESAGILAPPRHVIEKMIMWFMTDRGERDGAAAAFALETKVTAQQVA